MEESKTIDLYLVSGFLGAGKTSFLQNILQSIDTSRVGVIVNEYGSISIDGKLLGEDDDMKLVEINHGSIFCACIKGGFVKTLAAFLQQPVDRLYVEASGMADPSSIESLLEDLEPLIQKRYKTDRRYCYRGCVCMVDAGHFIALSNSILPPVKQVLKSNLVVVNKADTVSEAGLQQVHEAIRQIRPDVPIYDTIFGKVPLELIHQALTGEGDWETVSMNLPTNRPYGAIVELPDTCESQKMECFLKELSSRIYRMKGFFGAKEGQCVISCVGEDVQVKPYTSKRKRENKLVLITFYEDGLTEWIKEVWGKWFETEIVLEED